MMTSTQIRQSYLDFFKEKLHTIVPSSSLLPDSPNLLFTNAGMNQFVPIFLGQTQCPYTPGRAADTQKCIRAGGKHNDLDDVGLDTYHHTFFEMLGNWSFGDYFKREAIAWAWELVVERWGFPANRVYATIYNPDKTLGEPAERDQEAWGFWAEKFTAAGLDPAIHIVNGNKKDNFWMMGETGPCGPCSELHIDLTPEGDTQGSLVNQGDARCIEIWNLVFIQFNANPDGTFSPLPAQHVDTGMGFERVASIIQGTKNFTDFKNAKISNYETDIFRPLFDAIEKMCGLRYESTLPGQKHVLESEKYDSNTAGHTYTHDTPASVPLSSLDPAEIPIHQVSGHVYPSKPPISEAQTPGYNPETPVYTPQKHVSLLAYQFSEKAAATSLPSPKQIAIDIAFRVIADHIRTLSFAIADGISPGNNDRNYVLRRILRRAVRYGRTLGFQEPFFYKLVPVLVQEMGGVFPELHTRQKHIEETLKREEESFNKTLDKGLALFEAEAAKLSGRVGATPTLPENRTTLISGDFAFRLYDEQGFPLDLTELMARERGLTVDVAGFEILMEEQRSRARAAQKKTVIALSEIETKEATHFLGYDHDHTGAQVLEVLSVKDKTAVILTNSVCYAEMGGQVGDTGEIVRGATVWRIASTQKSGSTWLHFLENRSYETDRFYDAPAVGDHVTLTVDTIRRAAIQRHHSVTHLLHWALHEVVSHEATQKGSAVGPDKLTFDFNSGALTPAQVREIERLVNEKIMENAPIVWNEVPYAEVKGRPDIMQFFGDKYGEVVRVVDIGGYSKELCAGTHARSTGEIGLFRILGEAAVAAGVRRIEAVAGLCAYESAIADSERLKSFAAKLNSPLAEIEKKLDALLAQQKELEKSLKAAQQREAGSRAKDLLAQAETLQGVPTIIANLGTADGDTLQAVADALKSHGFSGVVLLGGVSDLAVALVASVSSDFTSKFQAGKIIQTIAPIVGGKGGGRPDSARGGGKDPTKLEEALAAAKAILH